LGPFFSFLRLEELDVFGHILVYWAILNVHLFHFNLNLQVFIPLGSYLKVCRIFECVKAGPEKGFVAKQGSKIDYESLALGGMQEVRHVFARIVFDTVYPLKTEART
jgi:hypothetical protein